jgi:hypothetical protein
MIEQVLTDATWAEGPVCDLCRGRLADVALDARPLCLRCADLIVERAVAVHGFPLLREALGPIL